MFSKRILFIFKKMSHKMFFLLNSHFLHHLLKLLILLRLWFWLILILNIKLLFWLKLFLLQCYWRVCSFKLLIGRFNTTFRLLSLWWTLNDWLQIILKILKIRTRLINHLITRLLIFAFEWILYFFKLLIKILLLLLGFLYC